MASQTDLAERFAALHHGDAPLLMPNPWDVGSAKLLAWAVAHAGLPPHVLPVGMPTSFDGAPFFLNLLYRRHAPAGGAR